LVGKYPSLLLRLETFKRKISVKTPILLLHHSLSAVVEGLILKYEVRNEEDSFFVRTSQSGILLLS
jgi:hypothetical protein